MDFESFTGILFLVAFVGWLTLPLVPALRELHKPTDDKPLEVFQGNRADLVAPVRPVLKALVLERLRGKPLQQARVDAETAEVATYETADGAFTSRYAGRHVLVLDPEITLDSFPEGVLSINGARVRLGATALMRVPVSADTEICLEPGARAVKLQAPTVRTGTPLVEPESPADAVCSESGHPEDAQWLPLQARWQADGDVRIKAGARTHGALVCRGNLDIAEGAMHTGSVKSDGLVRVAAGACIDGDVVARAVELAPFARITGSVVCRQFVRIHSGARTGTPSVRASVVADEIFIHEGGQAHGTVVGHLAIHAAPATRS